MATVTVTEKSSSVSTFQTVDGAGTSEAPQTVTEVVTATEGEPATSTTTVYVSPTYTSGTNGSYGDPPVIISGAAAFGSTFIAMAIAVPALVMVLLL